MAIRLAKIVQCAASILIFSLARDGEPTSLAIALFAPSSYSQFPFSCFLPAPEFRVVLLPTRATWIFNSAISCSLKSQSTANVLVAWWFARFAEAAVTRVRALVFAPGHAPTNNFRYSQHVVPERESDVPVTYEVRRARVSPRLQDLVLKSPCRSKIDLQSCHVDSSSLWKHGHADRVVASPGSCSGEIPIHRPQFVMPDFGGQGEPILKTRQLLRIPSFNSREAYISATTKP